MSILRAALPTSSIDFLQAGLTKSNILAIAYGKPALETAANFTSHVIQWSTENPLLAICAAVGSTGAFIVALPGLVSASIQSTLGFTASGVQAGSYAAAVHSAIGNVAAGTIFTVGQSAGAGGAGLAIVHGATQTGGAVMAVGSGGFAWVMARL